MANERLGNQVSIYYQRTHHYRKTVYKLHRVLKDKASTLCARYRRLYTEDWQLPGLEGRLVLVFLCFFFDIPSFLSLLLSLGIQISSFTQADLTSRNVQYVHSSGTGKLSDAFSFVLSDGLHEVRGPIVHPWVLRFLDFSFEGSEQTHWRYEIIVIFCS